MSIKSINENDGNDDNVANESMLTGESIPVTKVNADNDNHENCDNIQGNKNYNGGGIANESMHTGDLVVLQWRKWPW